MIFIQAFDPGETTGYCRLLVSPKLRTLQYTTYNLRSLPVIWMWLNETSFNGQWPYERCVIQSESFHLYAHRAAAKIGSSFPEIEVIGLIRLYAQLFPDNVEFVERPASNVKNAIIPSQFNMKGCTPHEKDALRHALLCLRTTLKIRTADWIVEQTDGIIDA